MEFEYNDKTKLALDQLPDEERLVVGLAHFRGLSHPQIAERLGVPIGTVKSRSFRAHKRLAALRANHAFSGDVIHAASTARRSPAGDCSGIFVPRAWA